MGKIFGKEGLITSVIKRGLVGALAVTIVDEDGTPIDHVNEVTIGEADIQIGAVEIKDGTTDARAAIADGALAVNLPAATIEALTPPAAISGFATSDKQLADGHNVAVTSLPALPTGANTIGIIKRWQNEQPLIKKTVDFTASTTAGTLWAPVSGKKFVICDVVITAATAGLIKIFDGTDDTTNRIASFNLPANGNGHTPYQKPIQGSAVDGILKYTTGAVITGSITVSGYEV